MKIRKFITQYSFLLRIVITIFVFICIPALIASYSITSRTYREYIASSIRTDKANLAGYSANFSNQVSRMRLLAARIGYERRVTLEYIREKPYNVQEVMRTLENYRQYVPIVTRIGVNLGDGYIYTEKGRISAACYLDEAIGFNFNSVVFVGSEPIPQDEESMTVRAELEALLTDPGKPFLIYSTFGKIKRNERLFVFVPVATIGNNPRQMTVIFELSPSTFQYSATGESFGKNYDFGIFDQQKNLLYSESLICSQIADLEEFESILGNASDRGIAVTLDQQAYTGYGLQNPDLGVSYILLASNEGFGENLESFYRILEGSVSWVIILFAALSVATAYLNYRPIVKLVRRVRRTGATMVNPLQSEIQTINHAIEDLSIQNSEMHEQLSYQHELLVDSLLTRLIEGVDVPPEEIHDLDLNLNGPCYCSVILQIPGKPAHEVYQLLSDLSRWQKALYSVVTTSHRSYNVLICNLKDNDRHAREELVSQIFSLRDHYGQKVWKISIGAAVDSLKEIRASYLTAISACENEQDQEVIFFEDVIDQFEINSNYPAESLLKLIQYMNHGEKDHALAENDKICTFIENDSHSTLSRQYFCFNIINTLVSALMKLDMHITTHEISSILNANSLIDDFHRTLADFIARTCDRVQEKQRHEEDELLNSMVSYVNEQVTNCTISLTAVADQFNLPIYTVSRLFKKATDTGFSEYITAKRIEYAKMLLMTSPDKSLKEIAECSGFTNASYFIKIFKKICGVTPTKYRIA